MKGPAIPMRPEDLPQQRLHLVLDLPQRSDHFHSVLGAPDSEACPAAMPRSARFLGQLEWSWSAMHGRIEAYYLSTNRRRSLWLLWKRAYDDNWDRWDEPVVAAHAGRSGTPANFASACLLFDEWSRLREEGVECFHWINKTGLFTVATLKSVARLVW